MSPRLRPLPALIAALLAVSLVAAGPPDDRPGQGKGRDRPGGPPSQEPPTEDEAGPPTDFIAMADELSQPDFDEIVTESATVTAHDGEELYVEVTRPDPAVHGEGPWPVVMEASPYHGTLADRDGTRIFPDPEDADGNKIGLTGYFAPRGYAVAMVDLRGTGKSSGCLDHLGGDDAADLATAVEWAADQPWSTGRVGLTGHSYVGSTPSIAAGQAPRGLVTIAPSAGLASMYDHQYQRGVPYFLQWAGPMFAYEQLALERDLPGGEHFGERPEQTGCGLPNSSLTAGQGQVTGEYQAWHAQRDWREEAAAADIPIFMIHGVNDNAARIPAAEWFFAGRAPRATDKVWIGQWDHGSGGNTSCEEADQGGHVNCRFDQWQYALHAWFDKHLKQHEIDMGPTVEAFLNGGEVYTADAWEADPGRLALFPDASTGELRTQPPTEAGTVTFQSLAGDGSAEFVSEPLAADAVLTGLPTLELDMSVTGQVVHLVTTLWVEDAEGQRRPANFCATNPHLRHDVRTPSPVVPGEVMDLELQCFTMTHQVRAGDRLVLEVGTTSAHHAPTFAHDAAISVHTGPDAGVYALPHVEDATTYPDVERFADGDDEPREAGPAQAPVEGSVVTPTPGFGVRLEPVNTASFGFTVEDGFDNAELDVHAVPNPNADIDLYLQRQRDDGSWSDDLASGTSGSLDEESLVYHDPAPGEYRVQAHNWAGGPTTVDLRVTFTNSDGEPGS